MPRFVGSVSRPGDRCSPLRATATFWRIMMARQNLFSGAWKGDDGEAGTRRRVFWRPDDARMGATLYELAPGTPESRMHMHYGAEEIFFVLSGRPVLRNQHGTEMLAPGDFVSC